MRKLTPEGYCPFSEATLWAAALGSVAVCFAAGVAYGVALFCVLAFVQAVAQSFYKGE